MKHELMYYLQLPKSLLWHACIKRIKSVVYKCFPQCGLRKSIEKRWSEVMDYPLNLENPQTFCEKLQWLKLHDHNPYYHKLVDKYEAKKIVAEKLGEEYVTKLYAVYNRIEDIDFDALPNSFVLKCTHDSGGLVICPDKSKLDKEGSIQKLRAGLAVNDYSQIGGQWAYGGITPRILAEEYLDTLGKPDSIEYKITCIYGKVKMITVCSGIAHVEYDKRFNDHFDREGNRLPFYVNYKPAGLHLPEKEMTDELIRLSEILSADIPQVRVDWYVHKGQIYFGEMTFYTWGGTMTFVPSEWDSIMGSWLDLDLIDKASPNYQ